MIGSGTGGSVIFADNRPLERPSGLLDAISKIQQYSIVEQQGGDIPKDFLTILGAWYFFMIGVKTAFIGGLVGGFLTPLAIGVLEKHIPMFGSYNPTLIDKLLALFLAVGFSLMICFLLLSLGKHYVGSMTKNAIRQLLSGIVAGMGLKVVFFLILYHGIFYILEPNSFARLLVKYGSFLSTDSKVAVFRALVGFRPIFLTSAYFILVVSILSVVISVVFIFYKGKVVGRQRKLKEEWV